MTVSEYLHKLRENYPDLLSKSFEPFQNSAITDADIKFIENELGYKLPQSYAEFLKCYKLPDKLMVPNSYCGDYANCYEPENEDDPYVTLDLEWYTGLSGDANNFLKFIRDEDMLLGAEDDTFLDAGFIKIGEFGGYFVFLDLTSGEVCRIYHEAVYDMSLVDGVDVTDYEEVRDYLTDFTLCKNFIDFLRLVCTIDIYDEDEFEFKTLDELKRKNEARNIPVSDEEIEAELTQTRKAALEQVMREENMSREEAIEYLADLVQITVEEFKKGLD